MQEEKIAFLTAKSSIRSNDIVKQNKQDSSLANHVSSSSGTKRKGGWLAGWLAGWLKQWSAESEWLGAHITGTRAI
ncbi:hypothetical protein V1477_015447 [Vespula maculifrons]|uniref:Uncharacterized protein n=1 Tax=Vespula maculifrons TaxID=7453 RepID=A0ABD2BG60_VESMC